MSLVPAPSEFSPLEEQFHTWDIVVRNPPVYTPGSGWPGGYTPGGDYLGPDYVPQTWVLSLWSVINITETHEGSRVEIEVNAEEPAIPHIQELVTDLLFSRDQQLLYRMRVVDSEDNLTRDAATVKFSCVSYDKLLERRILHEDWLLDGGDIDNAWRLIDYTQRKYGLGITRGTRAPGHRRQRSLDAGDDILSAINDFAQADGGFDWWIDADLRFQAVKPRRGKTHDVQWQLGGEVGELARINPIEDYASLIMATGANSEVRIPRADGEEDVYPPPDPQIAQLPGALPLGLWEMTTSDTDVITTASLIEKARWHLGDKGMIRPTYKVTLEPGVWQPTFGLGDIVMLRINTVRANVKVPIRIEELQINCDSNGAERVSMSVRAEEPETPISPTGGPAPLPTLFAPGAPTPNGRTVQHHRLDAADDLGAIIRSLRKRLDRAERSRGMGGGAGANILDGEGPPVCLTGSPGDYYVDTLDWRLYGPKYEGGSMLSPPVSWSFREMVNTPNDRLLNSEIGWVGYIYEDVDIVGFRFDGLTCGITDTFDRADGPLGSDWVSCPAIPAFNTANHDLKITTLAGSSSDPGRADKGAAGTVEDTTAPSNVGNTMRWAHAQSTTGTQSIEVYADLYQFWNSAGGYFYLFTNANATGAGCILAEISHANYDMPTRPQQPLIRFTAFEADGTPHTDGYETIPLYFGSSNIRIRLESDPDGENRLYYDPDQPTTGGAIPLLKTWHSPIPVVGPYVGMGTSWGDASNGYRYSPKFNAVTIGCPGAGVIGAPDVPPTPVGGEVTVSVWDWDRKQLLYRTTAPADGTDWVDIPPVRFSMAGGVATTGTSQRWCVSIGGAAVPVRTPGNQFIYNSWPPFIGAYGSYIGPVGESPTSSQGYFGPFPILYVKFQSQKCLAAIPEVVDPFEWGTVSVVPDKLISGEVGKTISVSNTGYLLGWRYRRMAGQSSPTTWTVWKWTWRYYDPQYANIKPFADSILAQVTESYTGEGEFEVRLDEPILMDWMGKLGPRSVVISAGGTAIGIDITTTGASTNSNSGAGWYNYYFGDADWNETIGEFPQNNIPGSTYPNYYAWPMSPIMLRGDVPAWPTTDLKRSGSTRDPEGARAELHHNIGYTSSGADYNGLRFYEGGPSHDQRSWSKDDGVPYWSSSMVYDGYSGVTHYTDDWYDEEYGVVYPEPNRYTNKWAYYSQYYDYSYSEIWASLDPNNPYWPGADWGIWWEYGAWDDDAYYSITTEGPDHAAGFSAESSSYGPLTKGGVNPTTGIARMFSVGYDGIAGTQLSVTPQVIQACFQPEGTRNTWWYGDGSTSYGLTPKGCVVPLITAASATATAADEPWQKQFFRQIGVNTVSFNAGVGTIPVPTGMGLPAVVNAQVDGVTAGGMKVAQARRTGDNVITVALESTYTGSVAINWSVDAAAITFGTPPPSIDTIRNPGSSYLYGAQVEYNASGGTWPFELVSWGSTLVTGCVLKDFTGATVGGPFTVEDVGGGVSGQRVLWDAGRNWYLPGEQGQFRMTNPDGQTSSWNVITWYEEDVLREIVSDSALLFAAPRIAEEEPEGIPAPPTRYANNPRLQPKPVDPVGPVVEPLRRVARAEGDESEPPPSRGPDSPRERRGRLTATERKEQRIERTERQRLERLAKAGLPLPEEEFPSPETPEQ